MNSKSKDDVWLMVRKDGKTQTVMPGMMFVGREECDIILQSASSDKRHAVIFFDSKKRETHIKDLNSLTGTYVNGMRIPEQTYMKLKPLDNLRFGYGPDIFILQTCKSSSQPSPSHKTPDKSLKQAIGEKRTSHREDKVPPVISKPSVQDRSEAKKNLEDSLEDLNKVANINHSSGDARSFESEDSVQKSVSPAFSSLTFKRSNTRVINSPANSLSTSLSLEKGDSIKTPDEIPPKQIPGTSSAETTLKMSPAAESPTSVGPSSPLEQQSPSSVDKDDSAESAPLAMAFTVAFDNPMPKKKFSIRDSISKYAPRKSEAERASRQKTEKPAEPVIKKVVEPVISKTCQVELRKKKSPSEKNCKADNGWMLNSPTDEVKLQEPKLSNGATYLIEKMFLSEDSEDLRAPQQSLESKRSGRNATPAHEMAKSGSHQVAPVDDDAKSDTGTYTVDDELDDKAVKDARRKIDEIFGVQAAELNEKVLREKTSHASKDGVHAKPIADETWTNIRKEPPIIPPVRTKRRLPTPPVQQLMDASSLSTEEKQSHSMYDTYTTSNRPQTLYSTFPKEGKRENSVIDKRSPVMDQTSVNLPSKRLTVNNLELLQNSCSSGKTSPVINGHQDMYLRTSPYAGNWRRSPWHLSGSDMDLDHMRVETSSVLSDVSASTEPPSINCHPATSRSDAGPQMKFNRAFALRRARLGLETELPPPSKSLVLRDSKPPVKESAPRPTAVSPFSRQDGGRFSLRLPKSSSKPVANKAVTKPSGIKTPTTPIQKFGHRRMDSDPSKLTYSRRGADQKASPQIKTSNQRPAFQRAASFSNNDEDPESDLLKGYAWKPSDRHSVSSSLRTIPRKTQAPAKKEGDDLYNENRASPKPIEKNELSALDNLVIQATSQLSAKLKTAAYRLLVKERDKFTEDSNERLMIDEVLPRVSESDGSPCSTCGERGVSQDLANILKNLKRVEQSLKVLTIVVDEERLDHRRMHCHNNDVDDNLYITDL